MFSENRDKNKSTFLETWSGKSTRWIGSTQSLIGHTVIFVFFFVLGFDGYGWDKILLFLTTIVSLEAIYLSIFIQMTINRHAQSLEEVEEGIDEIHDDIVEIQDDVDEIQEDVDEITTDEESPTPSDTHTHMTLNKIEQKLQKLMEDFQTLQKQNDSQKHE